MDCEWLDSDALAQVLRLAKDGLPVCLKRIPKLPGRVADKHVARSFRQSLEALTGLDNVSSDFANVSQNPPLVSGPGAPDFWCREVGDDLLFFFGHPASRGLNYPMRYGQSAEARAAVRDVELTTGEAPCADCRLRSRHSSRFCLGCRARGAAERALPPIPTSD